MNSPAEIVPGFSSFIVEDSLLSDSESSTLATEPAALATLEVHDVQTTWLLLRLPFEIRDKIFCDILLFPACVLRFDWQNRDAPFPRSFQIRARIQDLKRKIHPYPPGSILQLLHIILARENAMKPLVSISLLYVCRQFYLEGKRIFWERNVFDLGAQYRSNFDAWTWNISPRSQIKHLCLQYRLPRHLVPAYQTSEDELSERFTLLKILNQWPSCGNLKTVTLVTTIPTNFMIHLQTVRTSREIVNNDELPAIFDATFYGYHLRTFKEASKDAYLVTLKIKLAVYLGMSKEKLPQQLRRLGQSPIDPNKYFQELSQVSRRDL